MGLYNHGRSLCGRSQSLQVRSLSEKKWSLLGIRSGAILLTFFQLEIAIDGNVLACYYQRTMNFYLLDREPKLLQTYHIGNRETCGYHLLFHDGVVTMKSRTECWHVRFDGPMPPRRASEYKVV